MTPRSARLLFALCTTTVLACGDDASGPGGATDTRDATSILEVDSSTGTTTDTGTTAPTDTGTTAPTDTTTAPTDTTTSPTDTATTSPTDTSTPNDTGAECGNDQIEGNEPCDGDDLGAATCESLGFEPGGTLACKPGCAGFDITGCVPGCGNGTLEDGELCDGTVFIDDANCTDLGYDGGTLGCADNCFGVDVSACTTAEPCGNDSVGGPEACDGTDMGEDGEGGAITCETFGFEAGGTLACRSDCSNWDVTGCGDNLPGWTCPPVYFGDGECDCGCGIPDVDCEGGGIAACLYCNDPGSCATQPGCGEISPTNTGVCEGTVVDCGNGVAGPGEVCDGEDLRDNDCQSLGFLGGTLACTGHCSFDTSGCEAPEVPADWQCDALWYGDGDCDCGCGAQDLDCASTTDVSECAFCSACGEGECGDLVDTSDTTQCDSAVPAGWTCEPTFYGDGDCDCGCGVKDSDCATTNDVDACDFCIDCQASLDDACADVVDGADTTQCVTSDCGNLTVEGREECDGSVTTTCQALGFSGGTLACADDCSFDTRGCEVPAVPADWTCDATWYGDGDCDCGCGDKDLDCAATNDVAECDYCVDCPGAGGACSERVDNADTTQCAAGVTPPAGWTCDVAWYGDEECDCGCGEKDRDCATTDDVAACDACSACPGTGSCAARVDAADTTLCAGAAIPPEWTCSDAWYGDGSCDCGCGAQDFDCDSTTDVAECAYCLDCGGGFDGDCAGLVEATDTTACVDTECGDRLVTGAEECDGDNLAGASCQSLGFDGGTLACAAGCTFDTIGCTRPVVPAGWACPASYYGDGDCDCGCGVQDADCTVDDDVRECDFCTECPGEGACDTRVDNDDTTLCAEEAPVPAGWTCEATFYGDGDCDCGCGVQDFDCAATDDVAECVYCSSCPGTGDCTEVVNDADTTVCALTVPDAWLCSQAWYGDGSCDCGCGAQDLDCAGTTSVAECDYCIGCGAAAGASCGGFVEPADTTTCAVGEVPAGWTCDALWYGDGDCDCGCGVQDFDCLATDDVLECDFCQACPGGEACALRVDGADTTQCAVPDAWTCEPGWFGDGECDCGCGAQDEDCGSTFDVNECEVCDSCEGSDDCTTAVNPNDTTVCADAIPAGWTCSPVFYDDGDCDCGCGAQDLDCVATDDVAECVYCDTCAASIDDACADVVDPNDTRLCAEAAPDGWACDPDWYGDGDCDCGCGVQDQDCAATDDVGECAFCLVCDPAVGQTCADVVDARDTTQCRTSCGNGVIDAGEDCERDDLGGATCVSLGFAGGDLGCSAECTFDVSACTLPEVPLDWACAESWYGDGDCDCGCGAQDLDCAASDDVLACDYCIACPGTGLDCVDRVDDDDTTMCIPQGWVCDPAYYTDLTCDCGCGAQDGDCATTDTVAECDFCDQCGARLDEDCADFVDSDDTTLCADDCGNGAVDVAEECDGLDLDGATCVSLGFAGGVLGCDDTCGFDVSGCLGAEPPADWACADAWYGDADCDCGCGAQDIDCASTDDVTACDYCVACPGTGACADRVDDRDTTQCLASVAPAGWVCPESYYDDGTCDCGCGVQDADCTTTADVDECLFCDACGAAFGDDCAGFVDPLDTRQCE